MRHDAEGVTAEQFPETLDIDGTCLPLAYQFEPGHVDDGVTLRVPQIVLQQIDARRIEWLVPGLLREKVIELMRALPKALRRNFVPLPTFVDALLPGLEYGKGDLHDAIATQLERMTGAKIPRNAWDETRLPNHLRMSIQVIGTDGQVIAQSRDLEQLRASAPEAQVVEDDVVRAAVRARHDYRLGFWRVARRH